MKASEIKHLPRDAGLFATAYIEAALWSSTLDPYGECPECGKTAVLNRWNEDNECVCSDCSERQPNHEPPADRNYCWTDLAPETLQRMLDDCAKFERENDPADYPTENAGHDFWLTRNRHGAGFWENDFGTEEQCEKLTEAAHAFGEFNLFVGEDGLIYSL